MKIWYFIRRPIGAILMGYVAFLVLAAMHVLPEVAFLVITGQI